MKSADGVYKIMNDRCFITDLRGLAVLLPNLQLVDVRRVGCPVLKTDPNWPKDVRILQQTCPVSVY